MRAASCGRIVAIGVERPREAGPDRRGVQQEEAVMTVTSVVSPSARTASWTAVQRAVVLMFVIAAFVALAFVGGRASVDVHHGSSVITPASISVPSPSSVSADTCRIRRGPC